MRSALFIFSSVFFVLFFVWFAAATRRHRPRGRFSFSNPLPRFVFPALTVLLLFAVVDFEGYTPPPVPLALFLSLTLGFVFSGVLGTREKAACLLPGENPRPIVPAGMMGTRGGAEGCAETGQAQAFFRREEEQEFFRIAAPLIAHPLVERLACYRHHRSASRLDHSIDVAWLSYVAARYLCLDHTAAVRGALLHDLFLYDCAGEGPALHMFRHPTTSLANARTITTLTGKEEDIIKKHMWPLTLVPPSYAESWVVCFADTCCSIKDLLLHSKNIGERFLSE